MTKTHMIFLVVTLTGLVNAGFVAVGAWMVSESPWVGIAFGILVMVAEAVLVTVLRRKMAETAPAAVAPAPAPAPQA